MLKPILALLLLFLLLPSLGNIESEGEDSYWIVKGKREPTIKELVDSAFKEERFMAYKIMKCESGGNPKATNYNTNGTRDSGLFQINSVHAKKVNGNLDSLYDPKVNVRVAKMIFDSSYWNAWVCYKNLAH